MTASINSLTNEKVKRLVKLRESAKTREQDQLFVVEGLKDLKSIIEFGKNIKNIYYCTELVEKHGYLGDLDKFKSSNIPLTELGYAAFTKASYRKSSDGFISTVSIWSNSLDKISLKADKLCVVLDETEKPGNLGAIIRTVQAMGVKTILLSDLEVDFFNPNVIRASRGLLAGINVGQGSKDEIFSFLEKNEFSMVGTSGQAKLSYWNYNFDGKIALIFGSEKEGLRDFWLNRIDNLIQIPMAGNADSLNLNASVACILAEYCRKL